MNVLLLWFIMIYLCLILLHKPAIASLKYQEVIDYTPCFLPVETPGLSKAPELLDFNPVDPITLLEDGAEGGLQPSRKRLEDHWDTIKEVSRRTQALRGSSWMLTL